MRFTSAHDRAVEMDIAMRLTERRQQLAGPYIKQKVRQHPYTLHAIAEKIGISHVAVHHWESGINFPATHGLTQRWARALGGKLSIDLELPEVK